MNSPIQILFAGVLLLSLGTASLSLPCYGDEPPSIIQGHGGKAEKRMSHSTSKEGPQVTINMLRADQLADRINGDSVTATLVEVILDPLAGSPPHRHPGPVIGYVLEGTFEFQVEGGPVQTLKAGDSFFESKMILHKLGRNPDAKERTRVLATIVHPSDAKSIMILEANVRSDDNGKVKDQ